MNGGCKVVLSTNNKNNGFSDASTTEKHYGWKFLFPEIYHFKFSNKYRHNLGN